VAGLALGPNIIATAFRRGIGVWNCVWSQRWTCQTFIAAVCTQTVYVNLHYFCRDFVSTLYMKYIHTAGELGSW